LEQANAIVEKPEHNKALIAERLNYLTGKETAIKII